MPLRQSTTTVPRLNRTKIVATIGPASESPDTVGRLIEAGVSVFRLNFSHGTLADHARRLGVIRGAAAAASRPVGVLGDLCGPKIRLGPVPEGAVLNAGDEVVIWGSEAGVGINRGEPGLDGRSLVVTHAGIAQDVRPGHRVLIADGSVRMLATSCDLGAPGGGVVRCVVHVGGAIGTGKGVNLPDSRLRVASITARDVECIDWAIEHDLDFLALSFVRRAEEIRELRERLVARAPAGRAPIPIVAKIEKPEAVAALEEIVEAADAIMVARGDLGVEMDIAQVPVVQRRILASAQSWGKPCIVATQMLETMIQSSTPTRAEASDVANAVFDGADAVMLSGETAIGKHPVLVVETMQRIVRAAEEHALAQPWDESPPRRLVESKYRTAALAHGAWHVARDIGARLVVCWSEQGGTARYLSQNNFRVPIVAYSGDERSSRQMALLAGVTPIFARPPASGLLRDWTDMVERDLLDRGWGRVGDPVVLLAGKPLGVAKATNSIAILHLGDPTGGYRSHRS
jgi:pyruvate kinase